jgi:hypothetical protein
MVYPLMFSIIWILLFMFSRCLLRCFFAPYISGKLIIFRILIRLNYCYWYYFCSRLHLRNWCFLNEQVFKDKCTILFLYLLFVCLNVWRWTLGIPLPLLLLCLFVYCLRSLWTCGFKHVWCILIYCICYVFQATILF